MSTNIIPAKEIRSIKLGRRDQWEDCIDSARPTVHPLIRTSGNDRPAPDLAVGANPQVFVNEPWWAVRCI